MVICERFPLSRVAGDLFFYQRKGETMKDQLLSAALELANRGFSIIPLEPRNKKPLVGWRDYQIERPNEKQIQQWWNSWPDANIGVVCGKVSNLIVLDVDGESGFETLSQNGFYPEEHPTVTVKTNRGKHYYYRHPQKEISSFHFQGGDVKADGGYVVAPPSIHPSGDKYEWLSSPVESILADPPEALLSILRTAQKETTFPNEGILEENRPGLGEVLDGCALVQFAKEHPNDLPEPLWYALITNLLPLKGGREKIHNLSKGYKIDGKKVYSYAETEKKIEHALHDAPAPHSCEYIHKNGFTGCVDCSFWGNIKNPCALGRLTQRVKGSLWRYYTLSDAIELYEPTVYAVEGFIPLPSLSIVYGAPGSGKSLLLADMGITIAAGQTWLGNESDGISFGKPTKEMKVIWMDWDNGTPRCHTRFGAFARAKKLTRDIPFRYVSMEEPIFNANDPDSVNFIEEEIKKQSANIVIIDNLSCIHPQIEENSSLMSVIMTNLRRITERCNIAMIIIHHVNKGNQYDKNSVDRSRGHSSIAGAIDQAFYVETSDDTTTVTSTKQRDAKTEPFSAEFKFTYFEGTADLETAWFVGIVNKDTINPEVVNLAVQSILAQKPVNQSELLDQLQERFPKVSKNKMAQIVSKLEEDGHLSATKGPHNAKIYTLNLN